MITYQVDILDTTDNSVRRTPMPSGWSDHPQGSMAMCRDRMCDCNLHGYRSQCSPDPAGNLVWFSSSLDFAAWPLSKTCDHSMPPKRYQALRAYLSDGRVIDLKTGETARAAA